MHRTEQIINGYVRLTLQLKLRRTKKKKKRKRGEEGVNTLP
jgi:uncharacterized membrane protein affecting hemolysin expression